ncbi:MAG TPA: MBOAT family O-acyltransferase, partial [Candidatus Eremiobacteraeota bacterium]|nr:MBOAT family O-acyltransferase [Candidatus Eremiobacteraeota bacterium]
MSFNSLQYLVFLPLTVLIFHRLSNKYKPYFLLIVSYLFYLCTHILSPFILLFTTIGGYFFAIKISETISEKDKKSLLFTGILLNIIILLSCREIFKSLIPAIGVSFFTFQNISYLIDCYLGIIQPERNFLYYALYLSFFPKLIQGPIERASNLIPQLKHMKNTICEYETLRGGVQLFFWGMFKKIFIADNIAPVITSILNDINGTSGPVLLIITYLYAIQIYCDFSGYTDMSLGSARLFGINLTNNFNYPYFSPSTQDFWRRWHITLSGWILDYIFKPLSMKGRNYGNYGVITALIITFVICGIWHGLTLNYICWGLYHGILISLSFLTYKKWEKAPF